jgi:acyl-coenzyme A thioesterase PaaI-like protein
MGDVDAGRRALELLRLQDAGADPAVAIRPCTACERLGYCRLGLLSEHLQPDGSVLTELECGPEHEGGPMVAHGGWTAAALDELVGHVPVLHGQLAVTGTLTVRYTKPVPVGAPLRARAELTRREGSRWYVEARLTLASSGAELARAEAIMVERDPGHFDRHQQWLLRQNTSQPDSANRSEP